MNKFTKIAVFVLTLTMCVLFAVPVFAANDMSVTYEATLDTPIINVSSEAQTVVLTVKANRDVGLDSLTAEAGIPDGFTISTIANEDLNFSTTQYNKTNGMISWYWDYNDGNDLAYTDTIAVITYTIPANTPAGMYTIEFNIQDITKYYASWEYGETVSATLTIKEPCCSETNPHGIDLPYEETLTDGDDHFYTWTAPEDGTVTFTSTGNYGARAIDIIARNGENSYRMPTDDPTALTFAMDVKAGDVLLINAYRWIADGTWTATFSSCNHTTTNAVPNGDGTHNVVCANEACNGFVVKENVACSGGTATCKDLAVCEYCRSEYGELSSEHTGEKKYECREDKHAIICSTCEKLWDDESLVPHVVVNGYCVCGAFAVVQDFNGGKFTTTSPDPNAWPTDEDWQKFVIQMCGSLYVERMTQFTDEPLTIYIDAETIMQMNLQLVKNGYKIVGVAYDEDGKTLVKDGDEITGPTTLYFVWECTHDKEFHEYIYSYKDDDSHTVKCDCGEEVMTAAHSYDAESHECVCGDVEKFLLTVQTVDTTYHSQPTLELKEFYVPYGANIWEFIQEAIEDKKITGVGTKYKLDLSNIFYGYYIAGEYCVGLSGPKLDTSYTMPAEDFELIQELNVYAGWFYWNEGTGYFFEDDYLSGWCYIEEDFDDVEGGAWYYFDTNTYYRAEDLTRVPYNKELGHGALAEDLAYNPNFIDAESAWYYFDKNGKYESDKNGIIDGKYVVNGMIPWHPGFVTVVGELYYFVGDSENGGNTAADGIVYVTRGTGDKTFKPGYIFFNKGQVDTTKDEYIAEINRSLFYFEDGVCLTGKGLMKLDEGKYIYIRSGGQLAIGVYYVGDCKYEFDENGYSTGLKNGIIDGMYYVNGHIAYGAGLVEIAEGKYIYVRSSGELVMDDYYYVTNVNNTDIEKGTKVYFDENGIMEEIKNGVVDGMYYVNNRVQYGAGVVKMTDENGETFYIYVRSNGQLATGKYWPTTLNGELSYGEYDWGKDGKYYPAK